MSDIGSDLSCSRTSASALISSRVESRALHLFPSMGAVRDMSSRVFPTASISLESYAAAMESISESVIPTSERSHEADLGHTRLLNNRSLSSAVL